MAKRRTGAGKPKEGDRQQQKRALYIRCTEADIELLTALVRAIPMATKSGLAREAMRLGLAQIQADPTVLLEKVLDTRGGAREGAGRKPRKGSKR